MLTVVVLGIGVWQRVRDNGNREDCESHLQSSAYIASANKYLSVWKIYCLDSYAALHAIGPGEDYFLLATSDRSPSLRDLKALPEGQAIVRSDRPIKLRLVGSTLHASAERSDVVSSASALGKLGIVVDAE